ncbi:hypothetical protein AB0D32_07410 [Micromonospora sp. NPDC048170]|uniref:hypothetical protein n=1 Tax=Micromonospora sp. NPDC048170 TaxID=3154819 RepID=UPI0033EBA866
MSVTSDPFGFLVLGNVAIAVATVDALDEQRRRQLGTELVAHVRRRRDNWWQGTQATALAVAAVGCLPTAAKVAELLGRRSVFLRCADPVPVIGVARRRGVTWLPELARRLAARLDRTDPAEGWSFVADLLTAENVPPPTDDLFVEGWVATMAWPPEPSQSLPLLERLRADPFLVALVPRLFEVDGIGTRLPSTDFRGIEETGLPGALAILAGEGRLARAELLDGCVSRFLRGDRLAALRPFVALHALLAPTAAEIGERRATYLRLLADAPTPVATLAQKALRSLDDVEFDALLDASRAVLARPDKTLVRAQLSWLDQLARRHRDRAAEVAAVLATGVEHPAGDIRDRSGALAARHGHRAAPPVVTTPVGESLPPPSPVAPAPAPITDPDELAEEVVAGPIRSALVLERILDAVVRLAGNDRQRLGAALAPVLRREPGRFGGGEHQWDPCCLCGLVGDVLHAAADPLAADARRARWATPLAAWPGAVPGAAGEVALPTPPVNSRLPAPQRLLRARLAEIGSLVGAPHAGLLAAPTLANGALDPATLHERLARLGDRDPWSTDLTQALLRLPAVVDEPLAARAAALRTPAGDRLAAWLRGGGLPPPTHRVVTVRRRLPPDWKARGLPPQRTHVELAAPDAFADPLGLLTVGPPTSTWHGDWVAFWPAALPGYRGLVAAHVLPTVASGAGDGVSGTAAVLPLLAEGTGTGGPALDLALAYGLGSRHQADQVAALDALLLLAASGDLDAAAVGTHLGTLAADGVFPSSRALRPLRDAAAAGAPLTVWRLLAAALPAVLAASPPPRGTPDLLTLAAETADATDVRIGVPGLADVAARGGSPRLATEARRLATILER